MAWFNSIDTLNKLIPIAQILIVVLTVFTIWASVHRTNLEKQDKANLFQQLEYTKLTTDNLSKKNTDLESELKENKDKIIDLKKKTEPRHIRPDQKEKLSQLLPAPASFKITAACRMMDTESCNFAEELIGVFKDLKWQVGDTNRSFLDDIQCDVVVAITKDDQIPIATLIMKALNSAGLKARNEPIRPNSMTVNTDDAIYLIVGAKKQGT